MKTLTLALDDELYAALEEQAGITGLPISDIATEALELWLMAGELDETELAEIDAALRDLEESGEAEEFFRNIRQELDAE